MAISRGEIYWVNWNPGRGSEQVGIRPALVIQNDTGNQYSPTTIVAAITTAPVKTYPFIVPITASESGLPQDSSVNLSTILTVSRDRLEDKCGVLGAQKMAEVNDAIKKSLALD